MGATDRNNPIFRLNRDRNFIIDQAVERVTRESLQRAWQSPADGLDYLLNEAAYVELARLDESRGAKDETEYAFWRNIAQRLGRSTEEENAETLRTIVTQFARETVGHFRPSVYRFATEILSPSVAFVVARQKKSSWLGDLSDIDSLPGLIRVEGEFGKVRRLAELGTVVLIPTHSSHVDSILAAWAVHQTGLPAVVYGADKHLFDHPLLSVFFSNLGAYKVDRRRRYRLYRRVLKEYSQILLERGYHSMFFPAGQRSRTNAIENNIKLGLLSTCLEAYTQNVLAGKASPNVYVVPVTINYSIVLEAETLINDSLSEAGAAREVIFEDEFSDLRRLSQFARAYLDLGAKVPIRFGTPMDVFGNDVDQDGESVDRQGRRVDPQRYLWVNGQPAADSERDRAYTRVLAGRVTSSYLRNNVVQALHVFAFALFEHLLRQHATWDIYRTIRFARGELVSRLVCDGETERLIRVVRKLADAGQLCVDDNIRFAHGPDIVNEALRCLSSYHDGPIASVEGSSVRFQNLKLLYFYGNRLRGYELERRMRESAGGY